MSRLLDDITEFFEDIISSVSNLFSFGNKNTKGQWSMSNFMKYAKSSFKSGYNIIKDALPVISIARELLENESPLLPNVSVSTFVRHFLNNVTPELTKYDKP